mgnify:CR=1 FL=1
MSDKNKSCVLVIGRFLFKSKEYKVYATSNPKIWAWTYIRPINGRECIWAYQKRYKFKSPTHQ